MRSEDSRFAGGTQRVAVAGVAAALFVAGCGGGGQAEIRTDAKAFFAQASAGGPDACKLASKRYASAPDACLADARAFGEPNEIEAVSAVNEIKIKGDRATARIVSQGSRLRGALRLVKEQDRWRFDGIDAAL
jgi:hypothetical protein